MAQERVQALLLSVSQALEQAGVPYAVVGGNAVAVWVTSKDPDAGRTTKDVDILLDRTSLSAATHALAKVGLWPAEVLGVTMFVDKEDPSPKRGVHVVIANELIRPHYAHPAPDVRQAIRSDAGFFVINLPSLLAMKLQSYRDIDRSHVRDMLSVELISDAIRNALPADLRERLKTIEDAKEDTH